MVNIIYINMLIVITITYIIFATWALIHRELREREAHHDKQVRLRRERN